MATRLALLLVAGLVLPQLFGCQPDCQRLATTVCKDLGAGDPVCSVVREVALEDDSKSSRCKDLLAAWPDGGARILGGFRKALRRQVKLAAKRGRRSAKATRSEIMESARKVLRRHLRSTGQAKKPDAGDD